MANRSPKPNAEHGVPNSDLGAKKGCATRVARGDEWARSIYAGMITLARTRRVSLRELTNDEIADLLRGEPFKIEAPKGGRLTGKLVHKAVTRMGVDRTAIKAWRKQAYEAADIFGIEESELLVFQLWHEWYHHEAMSYFELGQRVGSEPRPFRFNPVRPSVWIPPWVREPSLKLSLMGPPPTAHLVQALMGMFEVKDKMLAEHVQRAKEEAIRRADAADKNEHYAGHFDDLADISEYIEDLREQSPAPLSLQDSEFEVIHPNDDNMHLWGLTAEEIAANKALDEKVAAFIALHPELLD